MLVISLVFSLLITLHLYIIVLYINIYIYMFSFYSLLITETKRQAETLKNYLLPLNWRKMRMYIGFFLAMACKFRRLNTLLLKTITYVLFSLLQKYKDQLHYFCPLKFFNAFVDLPDFRMNCTIKSLADWKQEYQSTKDVANINSCTCFDNLLNLWKLSYWGWVSEWVNIPWRSSQDKLGTLTGKKDNSRENTSVWSL